MKNVFKIPYEVVGDGIAIARAHYAKREEAMKAQLEIAKSLGGKGVRPSSNGTIRTILFDDEVPEGFRQKKIERGVVEAVPHKGTKIGKKAAAVMADAPKMPADSELAEAFGWDRHFVTDGLKMYRATVTRLALPSERFLLTFPVEEGKPWTPPATMREITQSEYLAAFEAHNSEVGKRKSSRSGVAA